MTKLLVISFLLISPSTFSNRVSPGIYTGQNADQHIAIELHADSTFCESYSSNNPVYHYPHIYMRGLWYQKRDTLILQREGFLMDDEWYIPRDTFLVKRNKLIQLDIHSRNMTLKRRKGGKQDLDCEVEWY